MELIKNILFYMAFISGSIGLITLLICGVIRLVCLLVDHLKIANTLRECLRIYIERKKQPVKLTERDMVKFDGEEE